MPDPDLKLQQKRALKTARIPIKVVPQTEALRKPEWIRVRAGGGERFHEIKRILRDAKLNTVCEEASCPNIGECFGHGTATFMILGDLCTRRCPFCDVAHDRPQPPDSEEPALTRIQSGFFSGTAAGTTLMGMRAVLASPFCFSLMIRGLAAGVLATCWRRKGRR